MINNQQLKTNLKKLTQKVFDLYSAVLTDNKIYQDPLQVSFALIQLEKEVKKMDEFTVVEKIMNADIKIKSLLGVVVGTISERVTTDSAERCILGFIHQTYLKNKSFDDKVFEDRYSSFEELFYSDTLRFIDSVRLFNFESQADEIILENGLSIKKRVDTTDKEKRLQETTYKPHTQFSKSDFIIERRYTKRKRTEKDSNPSSEEITKELNESGDLFDIVIKTLRIKKSSGVYRDHIISTEMLTFSPYGGIVSRFPFIENTTFGDKCKIKLDELADIKSLFQKIKQHDDKQPFKIASSRLGFGLERKSDEDRILDYMIGLESLYLPDGHEELTFRLSLRIAFSTHQLSGRKALFEFIKKMYKVRSKIVHGKEYVLTKEDLSRIEEILRRSLKIWLNDSSSYTKEALDNDLFRT